MRTKRMLAAVLSLLLVLCMIPFTASAADPEVVEVEGQRTVFLSSFGRMSYNGSSYTAFRDFNAALQALGVEGGRIVFAGDVKIGSFEDIEGRGNLIIQGIGSKATGNVLDFTGTEEEPVLEVNLKGNIMLDFLNIRLDDGAYLFTNGYNFQTVNEFDTYHVEKYVAGGPNIIEYPGLPSLAPGYVSNDASAANLSAGNFKTLAAGSVNGHTVNGSTRVSLDGGTVENVVGGNVGDGVMNGNATLIVGNGTISNLVAGSAGGTFNGNITTEINGGVISSTIVGADAGATVNGSVIVALNGGTFGTIAAGAGTVTGKKIAIIGENAVTNFQPSIFDYIIHLAGGLCEPQLDGANVTGFKFTDMYGIPIKTLTLNGAEASSENGIYQLAAGESTVEVHTLIDVKLNPDANYVSGYDDGTFGPGNNMTKAEAITLLTRLIIDESILEGVSCSYTDVAPGMWYEKYIGLFEKLGFLDLLTDSTGTRISPDANITRAEFVQLLYEINTFTKGSSSIKLVNVPDVQLTNPFNAAINYAMSSGIVVGYDDGTFAPDNNITRAEVVTMVNRLLGRTPTGTAGDNTFSDISGHWAEGQVLAACNPRDVSWTPTDPSATSYVMNGSSWQEYVKDLYAQSEHLSADAIRDGVYEIAEQMKKDILNTPNTADIYGDRMTGTTYYISEKNGSDSNDGLSPETAWQTLGAMNKMRFPKPGTSVLFERGGVYRGQITASLPGLTYGSYGEGPKPLIMQSRQNYADPSLWVETEWPNVWKLTKSLNNVGIIGFDHDLQDYSEASYDETYGIIMNADLFDFKGVQDLDSDLQFYSVLSNDKSESESVKQNDLYLYSAAGNPGSRFKSIEIGENAAIVTGAANDVVIDNLAFKFTGGHGMGGAGGCSNRVVTNCVYSWLGGSVLSLDFNGSGRPVNYGNAVEIYGSCNGYHVENCWMYQIYDTAVTHQYSSGEVCRMEDIQYYGNLMEYCHWGIEYYNHDDGVLDRSKKYIKDVHITGNIVRNCGYGWGSITRYRTTGSYGECGYQLPAANENELTEYNIFDRCAGQLIHLDAGTHERHVNNIYIQTVGNSLGSLAGHVRTCDYYAAKYLEEDLGAEGAVTIIIDEKN